MKPVLLNVLLWVSVYLKAVAAGGEPNWEEVFSGRRWPTNWASVPSTTRFTATLTNSVFRAGGTNYVLCRVENNSSNRIGITRPFRTSLYLIVNPAQGYSLTPDRSAYISRGQGASIGPGQAYEWVLPARLRDAVPPGEYKLGAVEMVGVAVNDTNPPRGGLLISVLVDVSVKP